MTAGGATRASRLGSSLSEGQRESPLRRVVVVLLLVLPASLMWLLARPGTPRPKVCAQPDNAFWHDVLTAPGVAVGLDGPGSYRLSSTEPGVVWEGGVLVEDARCASHFVAPPRVGPFVVWAESHGDGRLTDGLVDRLRKVESEWAPDPPTPVRSPLDGWRPVADLLGLAIFLVASFRAWQGRGPLFESHFRPTHLLPSAIQLTVLSAWSLFCVHLVPQVPIIVVQILFAFGLDIFLGLLLHGRWRAGVSPLPVVLSMHFFVWFLAPWKAMLVIGLAIGGKHLLVRNGRPIFNPSALGLGLYALGYALLPTIFTVDGLVRHMWTAPGLSLLILVLAAVPLTRFPLALVSLGALGGWAATVLLNGPALHLPTTVIALCLLITEPSSLPRSPLGRLLTGFAYGVLVKVSSVWFHHMGLGDDLSKVLPIPLLNWLAPQIDGLAGRLTAMDKRGLTRWLAPEHRRWHFALFAVILVTDWRIPPSDVQLRATQLWVEGVPGVVWTDEGFLCEHNEAWCEPLAPLATLRVLLAR